jgi:hypothetical protein
MSGLKPAAQNKTAPNGTAAWVKWLRMQGHRLPATLEVTGSNPGPGKINLIEKNTNGIPDSEKVYLYEEKRTFELV